MAKKKSKHTVPNTPTNTPYNRVVKKWRERGFPKDQCHNLAGKAMQTVKILPEHLKDQRAK